VSGTVVCERRNWNPSEETKELKLITSSDMGIDKTATCFSVTFVIKLTK
jgi:hypothetical protein